MTSPRGLFAGPLRRRGVRSGLVVAAVALVGAGVSFGIARGTSGGENLGTAAVAQHSPGAAASPAAPGAGAPGGGAPGAGGSGGGSGSAAAGGQHTSASTSTPPPTIAPTPANEISGTLDWQTSACGTGWDANEPCKIYYHGTYLLEGVSGAAKLIVTASADGKTLTQQSFDAPAGGHRWGDQMTFLAPKGDEIDFQAVIQDSSGKVLLQTMVYKLFNH